MSVRPSPEWKAKQLFNSGELRPLAAYMVRWKNNEVHEPVEYVLEVIAAYLRIMVGQTKP